MSKKIIDAYINGFKGAPVDVDHREQLLSSLPMPLYGAEPRAIDGSGKGKIALPFKNVQKFDPTFGEDENQLQGDCTSMGARNGCTISYCNDIVHRKEPELYKGRLATEAIYGYRGHSGEGMSPSRAAQFVSNVSGVHLRQKYGIYDFSKYNPKLSASWGKSGPPKEIIDAGKLHPVKTVSLVKKVDEVRDLLYNGYGISIASGFGFGNKRDKNGMVFRSGGWNHQMSAIAMDDSRQRVNELLILIQNSWGCYSDDTDILTNNGWKKFQDLSKFDMVATLNKYGNLEFQYPEEYQEYDVDTKLLNFKGRNIDLLVTENHNMYVRENIKEDVFSLITANKIANNKRFKLKKNCNGINNGHVLMHKIGEKNIPMDIWLEFLGYFLSEGHTNFLKSKRNKRKRVLQLNGTYKQEKIEGFTTQYSYITGISQTKSDSKVKILSCLSELGFKFSITKHGFCCNNKALYNELKNFGKCEEKYIPDYVWDCSKDQLNILYNALMLGDGTRSYGKNIYYTSSKKLADDFQRLLLSIGYSGDIGIVDRIGQKTTSGNNRNLIEYHVKIKEISNETCPVNGWGRNEVDYKGKVYCVTVPNHVIYVRRNGNAVWCGNSNWIGGPKVYDQPEGSFWILASIFQQMIEDGECWSFSGVEGFPTKDLDWSQYDDIF